MRKHGLSAATFYNRKSEYAGIAVSELKRLRKLEAENAKLKRMYASWRWKIRSSRTCLSENCRAFRDATGVLVMDRELPLRKTCQIVKQSRAAYYRERRCSATRDADVIDALNEIITAHSRRGFWKCFGRLRLMGRPWNHKRVHRVYCAMRLNLPRRTKKWLPLYRLCAKTRRRSETSDTA